MTAELTAYLYFLKLRVQVFERDQVRREIFLDAQFILGQLDLQSLLGRLISDGINPSYYYGTKLPWTRSVSRCMKYVYLSKASFLTGSSSLTAAVCFSISFFSKELVFTKIFDT